MPQTKRNEITYVLPSFTNLATKTHKGISISQDAHTLTTTSSSLENWQWRTAIAADGVSVINAESNHQQESRTYAFITRIFNNNNKSHANITGNIYIGWTTRASLKDDKDVVQLVGANWDTEASLPGSALSVNQSQRTCTFGSWNPYKLEGVKQQKAGDPSSSSFSEVICLLTIHGQSGSKFWIQWIVDGARGPVVDCTRDFNEVGLPEERRSSTNRKVYPVITLDTPNQHVEVINEGNAQLLAPSSFTVYLSEPLRKFFQKHAPYNLKRIESLFAGLKTPDDLRKYMEQLKDMYHGDEVDIDLVQVEEASKGKDLMVLK